MGKYKFDWSDFQEENLQRMNDERMYDIYGCVFIQSEGKCYLADIQWETVWAVDRRGISINLYESNEGWYHSGWVDDIKSIVTAKNYELFKKRAEKEITERLELWEENSEGGCSDEFFRKKS